MHIKMEVVAQSVYLHLYPQKLVTIMEFAVEFPGSEPYLVMVMYLEEPLLVKSRCS